MDRSSIIKNAESNGNPDKRGPAFGSAGIALQCRIRLWRDIDALRGVARTTITQCVIVRYAVGKMDVPTVGRRANGAQPPASAGGWVGTRQRDAEICGMRRGGGHNHNAMRHDNATRTSDDCAIFMYGRSAYLFMYRSSIMKNAESNGDPDGRGPAFGSAGIARNRRG